MERGENHEPRRFCSEVNVSSGGRKLAVLWLHGAPLQQSVDATVALHCKTVRFNQLFSDVNICNIVSSKKVYFMKFTE